MWHDRVHPFRYCCYIEHESNRAKMMLAFSFQLPRRCHKKVSYVQNMSEKQTNSMRLGGAIALFVVSFGLGLLMGAFTIDTESSSPHWSKLEKVDIEGDRAVFGVFSISLSSDGKRMAVGDPVYGDNGGRVRLYQREGSDWKPMGQALIGEQKGTEFGYSVAMSNKGNVVAVGARAIDSLFTDSLSSFMKVYTYTGTEWRLMGDTISHSSDAFCGASVTISGNGNRAAMLCTDSVRVVEFDGTSWNLFSDVPLPFGGTKIALSSDGDVLALDSSILEFDGTEWISRNASLLEDGAEVKDFALSGDSSTIAASFVYGDFPQQTATTKAFYFTGIGWKQLGQDIDHESTEGSNDFTRVTLSMDGRTMAISSSDWGMQGNSESGTVRLYSYNGTMWNLRGHPLGSSFIDRDQYGVFMDLSGDGAVFAAYSYGRGADYNGAISSYSYSFN